MIENNKYKNYSKRQEITETIEDYSLGSSSTLEKMRKNTLKAKLKLKKLEKKGKVYTTTWFEKNLEKIYAESTLPWGPDEDKIKELLLSCLEIQYGSLDKCIHVGNDYEIAMIKIEEIVNDLRKKEN